MMIYTHNFFIVSYALLYRVVEADRGETHDKFITFSKASAQLYLFWQDCILRHKIKMRQCILRQCKMRRGNLRRCKMRQSVMHQGRLQGKQCKNNSASDEIVVSCIKSHSSLLEKYCRTVCFVAVSHEIVGYG